MGGRKGSGGYSRVTGGRISRAGGSEFQKEKQETANMILDGYDRITGKRELERDIKKFVQEIGNSDDIRIDENDGRIKVTRKALEKAERITDKIMERAEFVDREVEKLYNQLKPDKGRVYYLAKEDRADIGEEKRSYQQSSQFRYNSDEKNMSINSLYTTLYNNGANSYGLTGKTHPGAQIKELNETLTNLKNRMTYDITSSKARHEIFGDASESQIRSQILNTILENTVATKYYYKSSKKKGK